MTISVPVSPTVLVRACAPRRVIDRSLVDSQSAGETVSFLPLPPGRRSPCRAIAERVLSAVIVPSCRELWCGASLVVPAVVYAVPRACVDVAGRVRLVGLLVCALPSNTRSQGLKRLSLDRAKGPTERLPASRLHFERKWTANLHRTAAGSTTYA